MGFELRRLLKVFFKLQLSIKVNHFVNVIAIFDQFSLLDFTILLKFYVWAFLNLPVRLPHKFQVWWWMWGDHHVGVFELKRVEAELKTDVTFREETLWRYDCRLVLWIFRQCGLFDLMSLTNLYDEVFLHALKCTCSLYKLPLGLLFHFEPLDGLYSCR